MSACDIQPSDRTTAESQPNIPTTSEASKAHPAVTLRQKASESLKTQAQKMLTRAEKKLARVKVGDCVTVPVSEFDRSRGDPANIIGIVMKEENGLFQIGSKCGIISTRLARNAFEVVKYKGLKVEDVPQDCFSVRELVRKMSVGSGQGYQRCSCKKSMCRTLQCRCFKNKVQCNSACHPQRTCANNN
ncbi:unnamed protein product [Bemisia tabaci]|uniref:CRC domain-containing protein n=1 Tax=Bemisia tabaci TaxID=7038 RepID=A0A9P0A3Y1_BEMTA|nr:unnamed protein product [Bemisia tabaci]